MGDAPGGVGDPLPEAATPFALHESALRRGDAETFTALNALL